MARKGKSNKKGVFPTTCRFKAAKEGSCAGGKTRKKSRISQQY